MNRDDDLLAAMPDPPPPRPDRRKLAIEEALRQFDAGGDRAPIPASAPVRTPVRAFLSRPQTAAFATVLLIALVSSPVWLSGVGRQGSHPAAETPQTTAPNQQLARSQAAPDVTPASAPLVIVPPAPVMQAPAPAEPAGVIAPMPAPAPAPVGLADSRSVAPPPPPIANAPSIANRAAQNSESIDQQANAAPPPSAKASSEGNDEVVVTGSRIQRPQTFGRDVNSDRKPIIHLPPNDDAWNACTVLDPRENLRACRDLLDPGQPGATGRAAAYIADGLAAAWKDDLTHAITALDHAVATAPHSAFAYLNRGLAYQLSGDSNRALADFDRAIKWDPASASAYYHRSLLLRAKGETARADADAARARQLDPQNAAVLKQPGDD